MQHFELKGQVRQVGNKAVVKAYRKQGVVPCNLYGLGMENILFTVDEKELKALTNTPKSYIVDLKLDNGKSYNAVLHELQFHPVSERCLHVDFLAVNEEKPIAIKVPVIITGHSIGVQQGGKFTQNSRFIRISALMKDLPDTLNVDVTKLDIEKRIVAGDIKLDNVTVVSPKDTIICTVKATRNMTVQAADESAEGAE